MSEKKRNKFTAPFKAKVALEAVRSDKTLNEIGQEFGVHPSQVGLWKRELLDNAPGIFDTKRGPKPVDPSSDPEKLYTEIGRLKVQLDWLKKKSRTLPVKLRKSWISGDEPLPVSTQCQLIDVSRASYYVKPEPYSSSDDDLLLMRLIDEEYTLHPFYGSRQMRQILLKKGYTVNRKRVQRLMRQLGLAGMAPGPNTSKPHPEHKVYPYLLRGVSVTKPNQVWSTDITYCRLPGGFMYLTAIIDWYSRKALAWRLSNLMESSFCVECLEEALRKYGVPEIFNSDQEAQFTSDVFIGALQKHPSLRISMDGRGRALDNIFVERLWRSVKHEDLYLKGYGTVVALKQGLAKYFHLYNTERPH